MTVARATTAMPSPALDLEKALLACASGDKAALRAIYDSEAAQMLGVARRFLPRSTLAEEVVHDVFVKIWRNAGAFDPARGNARAWIYTILRHHALNTLRTERRMDLTDDLEPFGLVSHEEGPEAVVMRLSETSRLRLCLNALEPKRREMIVLAYLQGLTHGELAGRFGVPLGTMKSWIRRSLAVLKDCMA
ncbi:sigma-70 family RNA polymerase sigma factor [Methylobacterium iners]|uniref:ECF RNA polymerase sigma factor SigK n=1 Tax=Methylobacterium iners TaxID=418707 RepID=A0ABQ4S1Q8_9HYPH|nr:sigma-70 family RNA polymerase sigma factor [Methylobacterium iners]GJD96926.1 ECF RNA polymerase sigma factor SigK [Methylobacterium iners]